MPQGAASNDEPSSALPLATKGRCMTQPEAGVAVHVPRADDVESLLRNLENLVAELGPETIIEVVAHGPGLDLVLASGSGSESIRGLMDRGIRFDACQNTMTRRSLSADDLIDGVTVVAAGLAHIARLQWGGFAYVRP
jgi:intracellular sulfur oxidation DsrE/DsrF family protein